MQICGRCAQPIAEGMLEGCWYCEGPLCSDCWDSAGVCGCPGSDQAQADLLNAKTHEQRVAITNRPGPIGRLRKRDS